MATFGNGVRTIDTTKDGREMALLPPPDVLILARPYIQRLMSRCMSAGAYLCILRCADGSYYVGTTRKSLEERLGEHNAGLHRGYTSSRRPVAMVFAQHFDTITDAVAAERQVKGWSRAKKEAMIEGAWSRLPDLAKRRSPHPKKHAD